MTAIIVTLLIATVTIYGICLLARNWINGFLVKKILSSSIILADHRYFEERKDGVQIFILGSCEFRSGIDPKQFGEYDTFNFSVPRASYPEQYYFLRHYIKKMPSLKALVISVGDNSFCSYASTGVTFPLMFSKFMDYKELASKSSPWMRLKLVWYKWLYSSHLGTIYHGHKILFKKIKKAGSYYKRKFSFQNMKRFIEKRLSGSGQTVQSQPTLSANREAAATVAVSGKDSAQKMRKTVCASAEAGRIGVNKHFTNPIFDSRAIFYLEKMLNMCKDINIPVIAVCMPRSKYFIELSESFVNEKILDEKILRNFNRAGLIFRRLNYLDIYRDRDELFTPEGAELNAEGKKDFSTRFVKDIYGIMNAIEAGAKQPAP